MKTTVEVPDKLYRQIKAQAALKGQTIKAFFLEALREKLGASTPASGEELGTPDEKVGWRAVIGKGDKEDVANVQWIIDQEFSPRRTHVEATVTGPSGQSRPLNLMIDSGAAYSLLPTKAWKALKLKPKRNASFTLADGTSIERKISECHIALAGEEGHTPVILGEPGDEPLLGAVTLEILGLVLNPFSRTLQPMLLRLG